MEINYRKKNQIKDLAEFLALEYDEIETPLDKIAEEEGVPVFYDDYEDAFDGILIYDNRFYIHLNTTLGNRPNTQRGRFTLAHELGHYFIDSHRNALKNGLIKPHPSRYNKNKHLLIEREADYFASCILMPEKRFRFDCEKFRKFDFEVIENLAKKYNTSITACAIRFADIGTHAIMVIYMENNQIVWKWQSNDFRFWTLADGKNKVPQDSLAGQYFQGSKSEKRVAKLWAVDWFDDVADVNCSIYEQIIPYKNRVLSIVWE